MNLYESVNHGLKEAGEWDDYDEDNIASKKYLTSVAKYISKRVPGGDYEEARGFDAYRGPYAYVSSDITGGELWYGETNEQFQLETGYGWIIGNKNTLIKALSDEEYLKELVEKTKEYAESLNEAAGDRYIIRKYEGMGAPYGLWDTQTKKYVHRGEKEAFDKDGNRIESPLEKECRRRNGIYDLDTLEEIVHGNPDAEVIVEDIEYKLRSNELLDLINEKKFNKASDVIGFIINSEEVDALREEGNDE